MINFVNSPVLKTNVDQYSVRLDHRVSSAASVFGRYTVNRSYVIDPFASPGNQTIFSGYGQVTSAQRQNFVFSYTHTLTPLLVNELRLAYTRLGNDIQLESPNNGNAAQLGITELHPEAYADSQKGTPLITIAGFGGIGYPAPPPQQRSNNTYQIVDSLSWIKGAHSYKFGVDLVQYQIYQNLNGNLKGSFTFSGQFSTAFGSGFGLSDVLLGYPATASRQVLLAPNKFTYRYIPSYNFFAQDDWKLSRKITVNLGMRYELNIPDHYKGGQAAAFNNETGTIQIPSTISSALDPRKYTFPTRIPVPIATVDGPTLRNTDKNNWAPRAGVAYRPFGDNKTVVRAAYGVFYNLDQFNSTCGSGTVLWSFNQAAPALAANLAPVATLRNPFPAALAASALVLNANVPREHITPYVQDYSFGIQREILPSMVVEARYVGTKGTHLVVPLNINQAVPGAGAVNNRRPFFPLGLAGTITKTAYAADSRYNSLQLRLEQRSRRGLTFLGVYSFSKALDNSTGALPQNSHNLRGDRGFTTFDITQRMTLSAAYELPFGRGRKFGANWNRAGQAVLGGWRIAPILSAQSGFALTPTITVDNSGTGGGVDRPNAIGDVFATAPTVQRWFNTAAFALAPSGQFGNAGRGIIRGPGLVNLDASLQKIFPLRERHQLEFRSEFFNSLNHPNLGNPTVNFSSALFGQIGSSLDGRIIQFALRYSF